MIERTLTTKLITLAKKFQVITLTGPRQSGKTTLVRATFPNLPYVSLEEPDIRQIALTNNEEIFSKLQAGSEGQYDVVSIYHGTIAAMVQNALLQPIDTGRLEHWNDLLESFRNQPWLVMDGKVYSVPFTWGNTPGAYNPEFVPDGIKSWNDLKDPKFKDHVVLVDNSIQELDVARIAIGVDISRLVTKDELKRAQEWYMGIKQNARAIMPNYGEMADMLARKEAWITGGVWVAVVGAPRSRR